MPKKKVGKYTIDLGDLLGQGSFACVYRGHQTETKQQIAVKIVDKTKINSDDYTKNAFEQEIRIMMKLKSDNIIGFLDVNETKSNIYIILQMANQGTLLDIMKEKKKNKKTLSQNETIKYLIQLLNGFGEMFKIGIIHRDIKPQNIFIKDGKLKIGDFGFAKNNDQLDCLMSTIVGSPAYMAPQILMKEKYTYKCDIWSLGVMTYEMLVGELPFNFKTIIYKQDFDQDGKAIFNKVKETVIQYPEHLNISENMKDFIEGCLKISEQERFDWLKVFLHPIFKGIFKKNFQSMKKGQESIAYIMGSLRMILNQYVIDIKEELKKLKKNTLTIDEFKDIMEYFNPAFTKQELNTLCQILKKNDKIYLEDFETLLQTHECHPCKSISKESLEEAQKLRFSLIKHLIWNKNHQKPIDFNELILQKTLQTGSLSLQQFQTVLKQVAPQVPNYIIPEFFIHVFKTSEKQKLPVTKFLSVMKSILSEKIQSGNKSRGE